VVIEFSIIDVSALVENVMVLVSINNVGVTISMLVVIAGDEYTDELRVLSMLRERVVDVTEFIVVPLSVDD
jgi:hypothetical protein